MERTSIVVIGAGIIGSTIAWRLAQRGHQVTVLDRGEPGADASSAAAGALMPAGVQVPPDLMHLWQESYVRYGRFVMEVVEASGVIFEYRECGRLMLALTEEQETELRRDLVAHLAAGVQCEWLSGAEALEHEPAITPKTRGALFFPRHGFVDNARLSVAVATAAARAGAQIRSYEPVQAVALAGGRAVGVETARGQIAADIVVNAAGYSATSFTPWHPGIVGPSKGEILALKASPPPVRSVITVATNVIVPRSDGRILVGASRIDGRADKDIAAETIARLLAGAFESIPALRGGRFLEAWAGVRPRCPDDLPVIGPDRVDGFYWASGHLAKGILSAPATGDILVDLVEGRPSPIPIDNWSPERFNRD